MTTVEAATPIGAARWPVYLWPAECLSTVAKPIVAFDAGLEGLVEWLRGAQASTRGLGVAAPQVGIPGSVFIWRWDDEVRVAVNPTIEVLGTETVIADEGCLSMPGVFVQIERPAKVRLRARDVLNKRFSHTAEGTEARILCHEMDHLEGRMIIDRVSRQRRRDVLRHWEKRRVA